MKQFPLKKILIIVGMVVIVYIGLMVISGGTLNFIQNKFGVDDKINITIPER
jgi:hypothetical protein